VLLLLLFFIDFVEPLTKEIYAEYQVYLQFAKEIGHVNLRTFFKSPYVAELKALVEVAIAEGMWFDEIFRYDVSYIYTWISPFSFLSISFLLYFFFQSFFFLERDLHSHF
jgi:hypothetical protein